MKKRMASAAAMAAMAALCAMPMPMMAATLKPGTDGDHDVPVTVSYDGTRPSAMIPETIEFSGKTGSYKVRAYVLAEDYDKVDMPISIVPQDSFTLTKQGTSTTVTASVTQDLETFNKSDLTVDGKVTMINQSSGEQTEKATKQKDGNGTITANGISKGTWTGTLTFTIS